MNVQFTYLNNNNLNPYKFINSLSINLPILKDCPPNKYIGKISCTQFLEASRNLP